MMLDDSLSLHFCCIPTFARVHSFTRCTRMWWMERPSFELAFLHRSFVENCSQGAVLFVLLECISVIRLAWLYCAPIFLFISVFLIWVDVWSLLNLSWTISILVRCFVRTRREMRGTDDKRFHAC
jgi:hypothetical protein